MQHNNIPIDPSRIIIMGLPSSGKHTLANYLKQMYGYKILNMLPIDDDHNLQQQIKVKNMINFCCDPYQGRSVYILHCPKEKLLFGLRKRNFVNVIFIDTPFKIRWENCSKKEIKIQQFMQKDLQYQNQQYQKCLKFIRVQIYNKSTLDQLKNQIQLLSNSIVRPFRPFWNEYFMKIADIARRRSNCMKTSVGAVIVNNDNRIVSIGYNGTPRGLKSCFNDGCDRCNINSNTNLDYCLCLHAQQSAIIEAGILRTVDCKLYTTMYPCFSCAKVIKQAGIVAIYYMEIYNKQDSGMKFLAQNYDTGNIKQINSNNLYY